MTNSRRPSPSKRSYYITLVAFITLTMVISALVAFEPTSAWPIRSGQIPIAVQTITLEQDPQNQNEIEGMVQVQTRGVGVPGAQVYVTLEYPDGDTVSLDAETSRAGRASFVQPINGNGEYTLTVTDVKRSHFKYNPSLNQMTSASLTVGDVEGPPTDGPPVEEPPIEEPPIEEPPIEEPPIEEPPIEEPPIEEPPIEEPPHGGHGGSMATWHAPGSHDGLPNHDHGDAPPGWVTDAGYTPGYNHPGMTPNENMLKHTAMKGFGATMNGIDVYVIAHLDTHPNGQQTRFHSYQFWMQDPSGGVSHMHGWMDFGEGTNPLPNTLPVDGCGSGSQNVRPIIAVNFESCDLKFESWYSRAGGFGPDFGFNMKAQYYGGPEPGTLSSGNLNDMETWLPTGNRNDSRRMEVAWYDFRTDLRGEFWADQFGRVLSGPDDPLVGTTVAHGSKTYTVLALRQYIAPTAVTLGFPGNSVQKDYPTAQPFELPN